MPDAIALYAGLYLLAINAATGVAFAVDKRRASRGQWRTRERTLHVFELLGGWPVALLAMRLLRHKTRDRRYRLVQLAVILLHILACIAWWRLR
ncbi:MAG: DUF1294 domain-containing protein [Phycisphaeraceae bacterium]